MKVSPARAAAATALLAVGNAHSPARTVPVDAALHGFSPKPTTPPSAEMMARSGLYARADDKVTIQYNDNNVCGYVSGSRRAPFSCVNTDNYCALYTAHDDVPGRMACCDDIECHFQVTCIDYDQYYTSSACDALCRVDTLTAKCTDSKYRYCNTVSFSGGVLDFACGLNSISKPQLLQTTYLGQTVGGSYSPFVVTDTTTSSSRRPTATSTPTTTAGANNNLDTDADGNTDTDGDSDSGSSGNSGKKKKTPTGAIVGGVVGGVGAIGVAALAFVFLRRHKKKKQEAKDSPSSFTPAQPMQQGSPTPPNNSQHQSYYDPKFGPQGYSNNTASYASTSPYQPSSPGYVQSSVHSPDPSSPMGGIDPRTGQPSTSPSFSYAQTNTSSPPPQMMMQNNQQQPYPQYSQPSTSPQPGYSAYNAPPSREPPGAAPGTVHEAPMDPSDQHRGQMHELA